MLRQYENCPNDENLVSYLEEFLDDYDKEHQFTPNGIPLTKQLYGIWFLMYQQFYKLNWLIIEAATSLHACEQAKYLTELKENLDESSIIFLGSFAENYSFVFQDEVQSFHSNTMKCTIYHVVVYYETDIRLCLKFHMLLFLMITPMMLIANFIYKVIDIVINDIKTIVPNIEKLHLFIDGCTGQYKNQKLFFNLWLYQHEFKLLAEWNFFATSHGKTLCDGIGSTIKQLSASEGLTQPYNNQILTAKDKLNFSIKSFSNTNFKSFLRKKWIVWGQSMK